MLVRESNLVGLETGMYLHLSVFVVDNKGHVMSIIGTIRSISDRIRMQRLHPMLLMLFDG